jgi:uncharacterized protein YfdQ (DUF2303 family)
MLTEQAVEKLQQGAAIAQANIAMAQAFAALPSDFALHDLERFAPTRRRARGTFSTPFIAAFCAYLIKHAEAGATAFVNPERINSTAVLNLGSPTEPGHADNLAVLAPTKTAAYAALTSVANGGGQAQRTIAEFLEDWAGQIQCFNDAGEIQPGQAVAAVRKITIEALRKQESQEQSLSATRSALESVTASSTEPLPTVIYFRCLPYAELRERTFVLRLGVLTGDKAPSIVLRIVKPEEHAEQMSQELAELIEQGLAEKGAITTVVGGYQAKS